jgi:hypothetical protein
MPSERQERIQAFTACLRELLRPHVSKNACLVNGCKIQDLITDGNTAAKGLRRIPSTKNAEKASF